MSELTDAWHFHRPDLAQAYLQAFDPGLKSARGLFAGAPEFFRWHIERYVMYQQQGPAQALQVTPARVHDDTGYARLWKELQRADRAVLLTAGGVQDLYGAAAQKQLQALLGAAEVTASLPRTSIRRLTGPRLQMMARVDHGAYRFEDPEFQAWVAKRLSVD